MHHIRTATAALLAAALGAGLLVGSGAPASADSAHLLGLSSFADLVVDQAHGHVFVSGGAVKVAGLDGTVTGTVAGITSARGMTLTTDGQRLVVANGDGLSIVDPATGTLLRTVATGPNTCPSSLAPASGLVWFTVGDCSSGTPNLGAIDLSDDAVTLGLAPSGVYAGSAQITSVASRPDMLVGFFNEHLVVLDTVGGATPSASVHATSMAVFGDNPTDLALSPDGSQVVTASGGIYRHEVFSTSDLSHVGDYPTTNYPNAVAIRHDGQVAAGLDAGDGPDIWLFSAGATTATRKVDYGVVGNPGDSTLLMSRGLAYGATNVYAVTGDVYGDALTLRTVSTGPAPAMSITTSASSLSYGRTVTVTARLLSATHDRTVSLYATGAGTARRLVERARVDSAGRLSATVTLTRNTTFTATFDGDDAYGPRSVTRAVGVHARTVLAAVGGRRSGGYYLYRHGTQPTISARVDSNNAGRCISFVGQRYYHRAWRTFDSKGCLSLGPASQQAVRLVGSFPARTKVRVGGTFLGGTVNGSSPQTWIYLGFTR